MHEFSFLTDLGYILITAGFTSLLFKKLNQPVVIGYILAGFILGPNFQNFYTVSSENIDLWAEIGIIFILFSLGLEFSFKKMLKTGVASGIAATIEIPILFCIGYFFASWMGWDFIHRIFLGGMLSISSTAIIFRSFVDLNLSARSFSQFVFGILIFEDIVAILLLVLLPALAASQAFDGQEFIIILIKLFSFLILWFISGIFLLPTFLQKIKRLADDELYLLLSLGLCFGLVALSIYLGYSAALGAFVMGSLLAETEEKDKIIKNFQPVKNLFAAIFFVSIGMLMSPDILKEHYLVILMLSGLVLTGKSIGIFLGSLVAGQTIANATLSAASMAQIGEFSFILAKLGVSKNLITNEVFPIIVAVSLITTFITPYWMKAGLKYSKSLEEIFPKRLKAMLVKYDDFVHFLSFQQKWLRPLQHLAMNLSIFSVLIFFLFFTSSYIYKNLEMSAYLGLALALASSAPFVWAMLFKEIAVAAVFKRIFFVLRATYTTFFLLILINFFFLPTGFFLLGLLLLLTFFLFKYSNNLSQYYTWYERHFFSNYHGKKKVKTEIAPWDIHISELEVPPFSKIVGKSLGELNIRGKYGVTIASIQRGGKNIFAPSADEHFYPFDQISAIGGDDEILKFKDSQLTELDFEDTKKEQNLLRLSVDEELHDKAIREAGIRERYNGIIVGIEREKKRILNPSPNLNLKKGDLIWLLTYTRK